MTGVTRAPRPPNQGQRATGARQLWLTDGAFGKLAEGERAGARSCSACTWGGRVGAAVCESPLRLQHTHTAEGTEADFKAGSEGGCARRRGGLQVTARGRCWVGLRAALLTRLNVRGISMAVIFKTARARPAEPRLTVSTGHLILVHPPNPEAPATPFAVITRVTQPRRTPLSSIRGRKRGWTRVPLHRLLA